MNQEDTPREMEVFMESFHEYYDTYDTIKPILYGVGIVLLFLVFILNLI